MLMLASLVVSGFNELSSVISPPPGEPPMGKFDSRISRRRQRRADSCAFRPLFRLLLLPMLAVGALLLAAPGAAFATGEERTTDADDLVIRTDTRWAGGTLGGYLPVRVDITNHAAGRTLLLEFTPADVARGARVKRVVGVEPDATVRVTLSIPLSGVRRGTLRVYDRGRELTSHTRFVGGAGFLDAPAATAMLVVSSRPIDCAGYVAAVTAISRLFPVQDFIDGPGDGRPARRQPVLPERVRSAQASALAEVVPSDSLPDSWIDYSGLDFVAISRADLAELKPSVRSAILKWVDCGGNLIVFQSGKTPICPNGGGRARNGRERPGTERPLRPARLCWDLSPPFPINYPNFRPPGSRS
jgi:hypothetical protein